MAVTVHELREVIADLLEVVDRKREGMTGKDGAVLHRARRLLIHVAEAPVPISTIVCNTLLCPSRLELAGELTTDLAGEIARTLAWQVTGDHHLCPSCWRS